MKRLALLAPAVLFVSCTPIEYEDHWMDSPSTEDASLKDPAYLVSTRFPAPTEDQKDTPVVIAVHGFGAATPECDDFRAYAEAHGVLVSQVLLGGHGRSLDAWVETDRFDWGQPIFDEYQALADLGYRHVSFLTSSTAGPLLLTHVMDGSFDDLPAPENFFLFSPFIVSYDKRLYVAPVIGPILNNVPSKNNDWEHERFYTNRPHQVFPSLMDLLNTVAGQLDGDGITLPSGTLATIWYAERETTIDAEGITKLETGLHADAAPEVIRVDTQHHSFMRATGRARTADDATEVDTDGNPIFYSDEDEAIQLEAFDKVLELVAQPG